MNSNMILSALAEPVRLEALRMEWDKRVQNEADRLGVLDYAAIAGYGIASTSGIVVDGKVVHADGLPEPDNPARLACGLR